MTDNTRAAEGMRRQAEEEYPSDAVRVHRSSSLDGLTRRALGGAAALTLSGVLGACNPMLAFALKKFYRYTVVLEVDGKTIELSNCGAFGFIRGNQFSGGGYFHDMPMPSARRLPSGEVLVVQPPSLVPTLKREATRKKFADYGIIEQAPYKEQQIPSVFFLDDGAKPTFVDAYIMRAAQRGDGTRVKFVSATNEFVDTPDFRSIALDVPWFAPSEAMIHARIDETDPQDTYRKFPGSFIQRGIKARTLLPEFVAWVCSIVPKPDEAGALPNLTRLASAFTGSFVEFGRALALGERVDLPLELTRSPNGPRLRMPTDPRVVRFYPISDAEAQWASSQPITEPRQRDWDGRDRYRVAARDSFTPTPIGPLEFLPSEVSSYWHSGDKQLDLYILWFDLSMQENKVRSGGNIDWSHRIVI